MQTCRVLINVYNAKLRQPKRIHVSAQQHNSMIVNFAFRQHFKQVNTDCSSYHVLHLR